MTDCATQLHVSSRLATRRAGMLNRWEISFARLLTVRMAIVLLAVQISAATTRAPMLSSAPRRLVTLLLMAFMRMSIPPLIRINSINPPASNVTIISSLMPFTPPSMDCRIEVNAAPSRQRERIVQRMIPIASTMMTLIPQMAVTSTTIYGSTRMKSGASTEWLTFDPNPITT